MATTAELSAEAVAGRITNYLTNGGLFNPELMEHDKVTYLLIDCRAVLTRLSEQEAEVGKLRAALEPFAKACDDACDETCADELTANHTGITMGDLRRARQAHGGANAS